MAWNSTNNPTVMGWNQRVLVRRDTDENILKVRNFSVGINQNYEVPDLVTGSTDRITWSKGVIDFRGSIDCPLTQSVFDTVVKAADAACTGDLDLSVLEVYSDIHGGPYGCMVNTMTITANEREPIGISAELIGRVGSQFINSGTTGSDAVVTVSGRGSAFGYDPTSSGGGITGALATEQIVMFDQVRLGTGMNPIDCTQLLPIGFTLNIDNKLQQNYVLGCGADHSSLDAWSISPGQRTISGTVRFMSGTDGEIGYIQNVGVTGQSGGSLIQVLNSNFLDISGDDFYVLWGAKPPTLGTEKVVVELAFTLIAKTPGLHSLTGVF